MADDIERGDRTEPPTQRRRHEARAQGQVAKSGDLTAAVSVLVASAVLYWVGGELMTSLALLLKSGLADRAWTVVDPQTLTMHLWTVAGRVASSLATLVGVVFLGSLAVSLAQVGVMVTIDPLRPDASRLNPAAGLRRMLSWQGTGRLTGGLLKLAVVVAIVAGFVAGRLPALLAAASLDTPAFCRQLGSWIVSLGFQLAAGLLVLAVLDYGFQLWLFERSLMMTRQELRDELRQTEGDPQVRKRLREAHRRTASQTRANSPP